jgi:D-alanine-D-alanine ligase
MKITILTRDFKKINDVDTYGRENINDALDIKKALEDVHEVKISPATEETYLELKNEKPDLVFNLGDDGFRGDPTLEPHVAAIFDILDIPYTGNNYFSLALCQNKARAKEILSYQGIPTPKFQVFTNANRKLNPELKFPLIVKPVREDGSVGIKERSVVNNEEQLREQVNHVLDVYQQEALVEEFIDGREFNLALLGNKKLTALPIAEVDFSGMPSNMPRIVSYRAKWVKQSVAFKKTPVICPAQIDEKLTNLIQETAKKCFKAFACHGYSRIDFRYDDKNNQIYVLEVNPNPDISADAGMARAALAAGLSYKDLLLKIIDLAIDRAKSASPKPA